MSEYTPTTEFVRTNYWREWEASPANSQAEFDRWLAEHDRQIKEAAWEEGKTSEPRELVDDKCCPQCRNVYCFGCVCDDVQCRFCSPNPYAIEQKAGETVESA